MNSTNLKRMDGGTRIKQGDISSPFAFLLSDEKFEPIQGLDGQQATIRLFHKEKIIWEKLVTVQGDQVIFTFDEVLPIGLFTIEVSVAGYVFPSDNECKLKVEKSSKKYELKELIPLDLLEMTNKIKAFESTLAGYRLYDDSEVRGQISQITADFERLSDRMASYRDYDDNALKTQIRAISERIDGLTDNDTVYDDTAIKESLADIILRLGNLSNYDDSTVKADIASLRQELQGLSLPQAYDDQEVKGLIRTLESRLGTLEQKPDKDTVYNDTEVRQLITEVSDRLAGDTEAKIAINEENILEMKSQLQQLENRPDKDTIYNDEALVQAIAEVRQQLATLSSQGNVNVQAYDDTALKTSLAQLTQRLDDLVIPPAYDEAPLVSRVEALEKRPTIDPANVLLRGEEIQLSQEQMESLKGERGERGEDGRPGLDGQKGEKGEQGEKGADGKDGTNGKSAYELAVEQGYQGTLENWLLSLKGERGATGERGERGQDGARGETGSTGPEGPQGQKGDKGEDGKTPIIKIGTVTKLAPDAEPTVTANQTAENVTFDFGIPQGATGTGAGSGKGITADDLHYWIERTRLYVQSRGQQLVTNSTGLLKDNTNFSRFTFNPSDAAAGFGMFTNDMRNADITIDEYLPVDLSKRYRTSFYARTVNAGANNKSYFYISCFDIDGKVILPHSNAIFSFRTTSTFQNGTTSLVVHEDDRAKVADWFNKTKAGTFLLSDGDYVSAGGYVFPKGTYSQVYYTTNGIPRNTLTYDAGSGTFGGFRLNGVPSQRSGVSTINIGQAGGTYVYPMMTRNGANRDLADHVIPNEWTQYSLEFDLSKYARPNTKSVKIGWLLNRGNVTGNVTGLSGVEFKEL